jgi:hypothetical protein
MESPLKRFLASASVAALVLVAPLSGPHFLSRNSGIAWAQSAVVLENLSFKGEFGSVSIPKITVEGSTASKAEIEALFDAKTVNTLGQRLSSFSARSVTIPAIELTQLLPNATSITTYKDLVMRDIRNGVIAETFTPLMTGTAKPKVPNKDFPVTDITMAGMTMKGLDLPLLFRFMYDKAQPGETLKMATAEQTIGKTTYKIGDAGSFSINEISLKDFKAKPMSIPFMEFISRAEAMGKEKSKENDRLALTMMTDFFNSMSFGNMELKGMVGEAMQPGKPPIKFSLDRISGAGGVDVAGRFTMQGLKVLNGKDTVNFGEVSVDGVSMASMIGALQKIAASADPTMADVDPTAFIPKIDLIRMSGIDIDVPDTKDPKERIRAKLGLFETKMANHVGAIPANIAMVFEKLQMDIPPNTKEKGLQDILAMGYKSLDLSARYNQTWDQATKVMKLNELSVRSIGMFATKLTAEIANVPKEIFTPDKAIAAVAALGVSAKTVNLTVTNESLFEKLIAKQARETKRKPEDVRAEIAAGATLVVPMMLGDHPAAKTLGSVLGKFVAEPKNLKINVTAKGAGIGATDFLAVANPMDILKKVDITASAND